MAELTTTINGSIDKTWDVLITPSLWAKVDPKHYKEVIYDGKKLKAGTKGKMKTEDSPSAFSFKVSSVNDRDHETITKSGIPLGELTITKRLVPSGKAVELQELVIATGPFAKIFAKLFFEKQIAGTLADQHQAIKKYVEGK